MRSTRGRRLGMCAVMAVAAISGGCFVADASAAGGAPHGGPSPAVGVWEGYQASCASCQSPWAGYGAPRCGCQSKRPRHLIVGLLDSVAAGVEHVLGLSGARSRFCDETACDDGCDAMTLQQLRVPGHSLPVPPSMHLGPGGELPPAVPLEQVPAPRLQDAATDPFADEQVRRKVDHAISPSAYFE